MRILLVLFAFIVAALCLGCSGGSETVKNGPATPAAAATPGVRVVETNTNIDLPAATANKVKQDATIANRANRAERVDVDPNATPAPLQFKSAPEDSRFAFAMQADGSVREVRIFDKHPTLASVEAISSGQAQKDVTIKLRSGKVVKVRTDRVKDLASASTQTLVKIAGQ